MNLKETWKTFADTWKQMIMHPRIFFRERDRDEPWNDVIIFNIHCGLLAGAIKTVLTFGSAFSSIIIYPFLFIVSTFITGMVLFVSFKLSGGEGKFDPTIKLVGYTQAVSVVSFGLPSIGPVFVIYQVLLLTAVGKILHELDVRTSFFAVVVPIILYMILITLIATIFGVSFFGGILSHKGEML